VVSLLSGGANLLLNLLLIPRWGGVGAAVATGVSYIVFFCARTVISRRLWIRFPVGQFAGYLVLILVNCVAHTWLTGFLPYIISAASIVITMLGNIPFAKSTLQLLRGDGML
jgi:O-antigen/teichoic acid export membrane protein